MPAIVRHGRVIEMKNAAVGVTAAFSIGITRLLLSEVRWGCDPVSDGRGDAGVGGEAEVVLGDRLVQDAGGSRGGDLELLVPELGLVVLDPGLDAGGVVLQLQLLLAPVARGGADPEGTA